MCGFLFQFGRPRSLAWHEDEHPALPERSGAQSTTCCSCDGGTSHPSLPCSVTSGGPRVGAAPPDRPARTSRRCGKISRMHEEPASAALCPARCLSRRAAFSFNWGVLVRCLGTSTSTQRCPRGAGPERWARGVVGDGSAAAQSTTGWCGCHNASPGHQGRRGAQASALSIRDCGRAMRSANSSLFGASLSESSFKSPPQSMGSDSLPDALSDWPFELAMVEGRGREGDGRRHAMETNRSDLVGLHSRAILERSDVARKSPRVWFRFAGFRTSGLVRIILVLPLDVKKCLDCSVWTFVGGLCVGVALIVLTLSYFIPVSLIMRPHLDHYRYSIDPCVI